MFARPAAGLIVLAMAALQSSAQDAAKPVPVAGAPDAIRIAKDICRLAAARRR